MRLAGPKIHQVCALCAQLSRFGGHGHGRGNLDPAYAVGKYFCRSYHGHISSILTDFSVRAKFTLWMAGTYPPFLIRARSFLTTFGGTRPLMSPPKLNTSFTMRELTNE